MKIIDVHSHWGTRRGFPLQTPEELAQQHATWNSKPNYMTEAEMADYFRASNVATILDFGFSKFRPLEEMRALHDYAFETEAAHRDVIIGHWIHIDPGMGEAGVREPIVERLVGNRDVVLVIELSQQVGDRLDLPTRKTGDHRKEQAVRRDGAKPFTLARLEAQFVDVIGGQRTRERTLHPGKLSSRQRGLLVVERRQ